MNVCIIGGGNIGTFIAADIARKPCINVRMYSSKPELWNTTITAFDGQTGEEFSSTIDFITNDIEKAVSGAQYIIVTVPSCVVPMIADKLLKFVIPGQKIGIVPGSGGAEFYFNEHRKKGCIIYGIQRVPAVARIQEYGKRVMYSGRRGQLHVASIPDKYSEVIRNDTQTMFNMECEVLPSFLCLTLTPSNPILHTTRLYSMFCIYHEGVVYSEQFLFYEDWTDFSSEILFDCDRELQNILKRLPEMDLTSVRSLKLHYESETPEALTRKIKSTPAFHGIRTPMLKVSGGFIPDFKSRYFLEDFPYGLKIIKEFAEVVGEEVPAIDSVLSWYYSVSGDLCNSFNLSEFGINSVNDIYEFYAESPAKGEKYG